MSNAAHKVDVEETGTELVTINTSDAFELFTRPKADGLDEIIADIRQQVSSIVPDVSTAKGRKEIASAAHKVSKSKTYIESIGKELADEQKKIPKLIDATRKRVKEELDKLRDEVRKPLSEWEEEQAAIEARKKAVLDQIRALGSPEHGLSSAALAERIEQAEGFVLDQNALDDYYPLCAEAKIAAVHNLKSAHASAVQYEKDQAELEELRRMKAQQEAAAQGPTATPDDDFSDFDDSVLATTVASIGTGAEQPVYSDGNGAAVVPEDHQRAVENVAIQALIDGGIPAEQAQHVVRLIAKGKVPSISINY